VCRRLTRDDADALDATQEALIAIARGLRSYDGRAAFSTWAYRVATNACLDELRRRRRRPVLGRADDVAATDGEQASQAAPVDGIEVLPERLAIDAALAELPDEFRVAVVLRDLCDLDYAQIAEALDIPPGTVRSRIARGRALLADLLDPGNLDPGNQAVEAGRPTERPDPRDRP
jgi:RNA polymerase sigma-70 factor (ECF subfamily)